MLGFLKRTATKRLTGSPSTESAADRVVVAPGEDVAHNPGEQQDMLRALFENTTAGIAEIDAETARFISVNNRYCQIAGRTRDELLSGLRVTDVLHPDEERVPLYVAEVCGSAERRYLQPGGGIAWVRISVAVTSRDPSGKATRLSAIVQDVTESHAAQEKLKASEALLRLSLEIGQVGCFSRDLITGEIRCGAETRAMHGFPSGEAPISSEAWLAMILPEDREVSLAALMTAAADCAPSAGYEYRFRHPVTGQIRHIEVRTRYEYDPNGRPLLSFGAIIDVTSRRAAEARITHLAFHDSLTALPNRAFFSQRLAAALERAKIGSDIAVLFLDLDGFKDVNDRYGHSVGDALLRDVATRLKSAMGEGASIARLGGDEFALIQRDVAQPSSAASLATRLIDSLRFPFLVDGHTIEIGTSIGIATSPQDGLSADKILKAADLALYNAKGEGRNCFRVYRSSMSDHVERRRRLEMDLRSALARGEFELFYQPILNTNTLLPVGMEALLRWMHPTRGMVSPDSFIPLTEELGLIVPIGEWVLARACQDAVTWPGKLSVAVNLSVVQFGSRDLVEIVASTLEKTGLEPGRLELEVTETVMLEDTEANLATLHRLKELGVRIALDDFGTGYSSLSYLRSFPFNKAKIDRSFTRDLGRTPQSDVIMSTVLDLCAGLGMISTVEGVEDHEQLRALREKGCKEVQGYLFSRPVQASQVSGLLAELTFGSAVAHSCDLTPVV